MPTQGLNQGRVILIELNSMAAGMFDGIQLNFSGARVRHGFCQLSLGTRLDAKYPCTMQELRPESKLFSARAWLAGTTTISHPQIELYRNKSRCASLFASTDSGANWWPDMYLTKTRGS
jgi:hypothetical protein